MTESQRSRGFGAAARVTALAASVMDLHVRMALQEVDREKRRLISGGLFLAMGGTSMLLDPQHQCHLGRQQCQQH